MTDDADLAPDPNRRRLDNEFGKFPNYMLLVPNVFRFSQENLAAVLGRFSDQSDLVTAIDQAIEAIRASEVDENSKNTVIQLLQDEKDVLSYSKISRNSVIQI